MALRFPLSRAESSDDSYSSSEESENAEENHVPPVLNRLLVVEENTARDLGAFQTDTTTIESLSNEVLLEIVSHLPSLADRLALACVNKRFREICNAEGLMWYFRVRWSDNLNNVIIANAIQNKGQYIRHLDLADLYWGNSFCIAKAIIAKCGNLVKLDLRNCGPLLPNLLDKILSTNASLKHLAVRDGGVYVLRPDENDRDTHNHLQYRMSEGAFRTLQQLVGLNLNIEQTCTRGLYVLPLCGGQLTSLSISATEMSRNRGMCHCQCRRPMSALNLPSLSQLWLEPHKNSLYQHDELYAWLLYDRVERYRFESVIASPFLQTHDRIQHFVVKTDDGAETSDPPCVLSLGLDNTRSINRRTPCKVILDRVDSGTLRCFSAGHQPVYHKLPALVTTLSSFPMVTNFCAALKHIWKLKTRDWIEPFLSMCTHLQHLNLINSCCHGYQPSPNKEYWDQMAIDNNSLAEAMTKSLGKGLVSLALPTCFIVDVAKSQPESTHARKPNDGMAGFRSRQRVGVSTNMSSSSASEASDGRAVGCLQRFVSSCPNVEHFELITYDLFERRNPFHLWRNQDEKEDVSRCRVHRSVTDDDIVCISQWTYLRSLTLVGIPGIRHGRSLETIMRGCQQLRRLSLVLLGLNAGCVYFQALCDALKYGTYLQELRLEQPYLRVNHSMCVAISYCSNLTRLCIIAQKTEFSHDGILRIFEVCEKLTVFHLITASTSKACKKLTKHLEKRYRKQRPALSVYISAERKVKVEDMVKAIPWVHLSELTYIKSRVCSKPIGWKGLDP